MATATQLDTPVIARVEGQVGRLTLNRPEALHALTEEMCTIMLEALLAWRADDSVEIVMIDHAEGTRGFCAGGDIRMLAESGRGDGRAARAFFHAEYRLNTAIHAFPKPYIALMDGITMGGGVGISMHGSHRVATENTIFAMPETGIGLFPDVGGGWFLPRMGGEVGTWLALTGARLKGTDICAAGLATHFVPSELLGNLKAQLLDADYSQGAAEMLGEVLRSRSHPVPAPAYAEHAAAIRSCFAFDSVAEIMLALRNQGGDWAQKQFHILQGKSPTSMTVALRQLRLGAEMESFAENMAMEYRIGGRVVHTHDFSEGVRAVIEDKDNAPKWIPARVEDVSAGDIDAIFAPLPEGQGLDLSDIV